MYFILNYLHIGIAPRPTEIIVTVLNGSTVLYMHAWCSVTYRWTLYTFVHTAAYIAVLKCSKLSQLLLSFTHTAHSSDWSVQHHSSPDDHVLPRLLRRGQPSLLCTQVCLSGQLQVRGRGLYFVIKSDL